jgi:phosphate acetyltransferase
MVDLLKLAKKKAMENEQVVIIPEGWDERVLKAVDAVLKEGLCKVILLGDEEEIRGKCKSGGFDIKDTEIYNPKTSELREKFAQVLFEKRKHKGMTLEKATELIGNENYFAMVMLDQGLGGSVAGSCICSTADLMRPALQVIGAREKGKLVTSASIMIDKENNRVISSGDDSIIIDPTPEQRADIGFEIANMLKGFGIEPKVAFLSHSTNGSGEHPILEPIRESIKIFREKWPKIPCAEMEMQADAAINPDACKKKWPDSKVIKGDANVLVFPNILVGNVVGHLMMQLVEREFVFMTLGMRKPVQVMGRSSPWERIYDVLILAAAQANME